MENRIWQKRCQIVDNAHQQFNKLSEKLDKIPVWRFCKWIKVFKQMNYHHVVAGRILTELEKSCSTWSENQLKDLEKIKRG